MKKQSTVAVIGHKIFDSLSDKKYLKLKYFYTMHKRLNLKNPETYTEKLQWLKLYHHIDRYSEMVDKATAKEFAAGIIGKEHIIPTLGIYNSADEIDFDSLPQQFVLKCTHDSGSISICKDKSRYDTEKAREQLNTYLNINSFVGGREWPYLNVKPRIIAEKYLEDLADGELRDYKFFCFSGEPKVLYIAQGRGDNRPTVADFFDMDFKHLDLKIDHEMADTPPSKPQCFDQMKEYAKKLSAGIPHVRVDFYEVNGKLYFGEMTFFHCSGFAAFHPEEWDKTFGSWIKLPSINV